MSGYNLAVQIERAEDPDTINYIIQVEGLPLTLFYEVNHEGLIIHPRLSKISLKDMPSVVDAARVVTKAFLDHYKYPFVLAVTPDKRLARLWSRYVDFEHIATIPQGMVYMWR